MVSQVLNLSRKTGEEKNDLSSQFGNVVYIDLKNMN